MSPAALQRPLDPAYIGSPFQQAVRLFAGSLDAPMNLTGRTLSMHLQLQGRTAGEPILITGAGQADGVATFTADTDDWDKGDYSIEVRLDGEAILVGRLPVAQGASEGGVDTLGAAQPPMAVNLVVAPAGQVQLVMASTAFPSVANIGLPSDLGALFGGATTLSEALAWLAEYGGGGSSPVVVGLAGGIVSQSLISGSLSVDEADAILLSGVISGTGAAAGTMSVGVVRALSGALMASSSLTGSLTVSEANVISLVGTIAASGALAGGLDVYDPAAPLNVFIDSDIDTVGERDDISAMALWLGSQEHFNIVGLTASAPDSNSTEYLNCIAAYDEDRPVLLTQTPYPERFKAAAQLAALVRQGAKVDAPAKGYWEPADSLSLIHI